MRWNKTRIFREEEILKMPRKKYLINLSNEECQKLIDMTRKGTLKARQFKRAKILIKANVDMSDPEIMKALDVSLAQPWSEFVCRVR